MVNHKKVLRKRKTKVKMSYYVYILRCRDSTLYTGCTIDIQKRLKEHQSGKGAKYTRGRGPLELVYFQKCEDRSAALKMEAFIKKLSKKEKLDLIQRQTIQVDRGEHNICKDKK